MCWTAVWKSVLGDQIIKTLLHSVVCEKHVAHHKHVEHIAKVTQFAH